MLKGLHVATLSLDSYIALHIPRGSEDGSYLHSTGRSLEDCSA